MVLTERVPFARHWASRLSTECSFAKLLGVSLYGAAQFQQRAAHQPVRPLSF